MFRVVARTDSAVPREASVWVDRGALTLTVKPLRRRREYTLPLSTVAEMIVSKIVKAEVAEQRRLKKTKTRTRTS
jgi:hypothetical protein